MAAGSQINIPTLSARFNKQASYHFRKKVQSAYGNIHDCLNRREEMDILEHLSLDELLNFTLEIMATCMSQCFTALQEYFNVIYLFSYDAKYKRQLRKRKNEAWLKNGPGTQ